MFIYFTCLLKYMNIFIKPLIRPNAYMNIFIYYRSIPCPLFCLGVSICVIGVKSSISDTFLVIFVSDSCCEISNSLNFRLNLNL